MTPSLQTEIKPYFLLISFKKKKKKRIQECAEEIQQQHTQERLGRDTAETVPTPGEGTTAVAWTEHLLSAEFWIGPGS